MATIGVFDSGVGGLSVANAVRAAFPEHTVDYREDRQNIPYGTKSKSELQALVTPILQEMSETCDVIVIACNSVSTLLIGELRAVITTPLIPVEPMIEAAAASTKSRVIAVCATPATLGSRRYKELLQTHGAHLTVIEPDCSTWALMIEHNKLDEQKVTDSISTACKEGADVIVLGCTHYHWIETLIAEVADGRAVILQPEQMIIDQVRQALAQLD